MMPLSAPMLPHAAIETTTASPARIPTTWHAGHEPARAARASAARKTSGRRRNIDPTTTDREYTPAELEFMQAMQDYKLASGRMFPTWSEALEVLRGLGYHKVGEVIDGDAGGDTPPAAA